MPRITDTVHTSIEGVLVYQEVSDLESGFFHRVKVTVYGDSYEGQWSKYDMLSFIETPAGTFYSAMDCYRALFPNLFKVVK